MEKVYVYRRVFCKWIWEDEISHLENFYNNLEDLMEQYNKEKDNRFFSDFEIYEAELKPLLNVKIIR